MKDGKTLKADGQLAGTPSVLFDAIALILDLQAANKLAEDSAGIDFVRNAYGHSKAIGFDDNASPLIEKSGIEIDEGVTDLGASFVKAAATRFYQREHKIREFP